MRLGCSYLSEPIYLSNGFINVLSIENKRVFRKLIKVLMNGEPELENFIFSKNYNPLSFKKNICFIKDSYNLSISSTFIKKLYDDIASFCNNEMLEQTFLVKEAINDFVSKIAEEFDFDFSFNEDVILQDIFKMQGIKPDTDSEDTLEALYEYIMLIKKYAGINCFVILGLHQNFDSEELEAFYKELVYRDIIILDIESYTDFVPCQNEKLTIIDKDLCEIVENKTEN